MSSAHVFLESISVILHAQMRQSREYQLMKYLSIANNFQLKRGKDTKAKWNTQAAGLRDWNLHHVRNSQYTKLKRYVLVWTYEFFYMFCIVLGLSFIEGLQIKCFPNFQGFHR